LAATEEERRCNGNQRLLASRQPVPQRCRGPDGSTIAVTESPEHQQALDDMLSEQVALMSLLAESAPTSTVFAAAEEFARWGSPHAAGALFKERTLQVKDLLDRRARRDRNLSAIFDTAKDLASLKDLDAILTSIAVRCREILSADLAYLGLFNDSGTETSIRVTDGAISPHLLNLRLPINIGLGGPIARTGQAQQSPDYLDDERIAHNAGIDRAVRAEQIKAIAGVPLKVSGTVIGILFAAHRAERTFAADEVDMMSSLAALAALAIEKTQLLDQSRKALAELESAHSIAMEHQAATDRAAAAHELFNAIIFRGGGLAEVTDALYDVLSVPTVVLDEEGELLASAGFAERPTNLPHVPRRDPDAGTSHEGREGKWIVIPIDAVQDRLGTLALLHPTSLPEVNARIASRAATVAALLLFWRRSMAEAGDRDRSAFLMDVVSRPPGAGPDRPAPSHFANLPVGSPWRLLAITADVSDHRLLTALKRRLGSHQSMHVRHANQLLVAFWSATAVPSAAVLAPELSDDLGCDVVIGEAVSIAGLAGLRTAYEEASKCHQVLVKLGQQRAGANRDRLGVAGLLLSDVKDLREFVETHLGPVLAYDARRSTDLCLTLEAYFRNNRRAQETATSLHVHPNTVAQRLARVDQLLGPDWRNANQSLNVQLSLTINTVVGELNQDHG